MKMSFVNGCAVLMLMAMSAADTHARECRKAVLFIGNSITEHRADPAIGWTGNWGMAASAADKDYVAVLLKLLEADSRQKCWAAEISNAPAFETDPPRFMTSVDLSIKTSRAAIVIVQMGENFDLQKYPLDYFSTAYRMFLSSLSASDSKIVCISTWWASPLKDKEIRKACGEVRGRYVDISDLQRSKPNVAGNERVIAHAGVAAHPGDAGMRAIATRVFDALK